MVKKVIYTWQHFERDLNKIYEEIKKRKWNIRGVYAIPKGGLVLGVCIANKLGVSLFCDYEEFKEQFPHGVSADIIVVDDISDTGRTMIKIPDICNGHTLTLHAKQDSHFIPSYYCGMVAKDEWVVYPWEPKEKETKRDDTL